MSTIRKRTERKRNLSRLSRRRQISRTPKPRMTQRSMEDFNGSPAGMAMKLGRVGDVMTARGGHGGGDGVDDNPNVVHVYHHYEDKPKKRK